MNSTASAPLEENMVHADNMNQIALSRERKELLGGGADHIAGLKCHCVNKLLLKVWL
jgi:hypothetical protein